MDREPNHEAHLIAWFSRNPIVGAVAAVCSIVSIPLSIYSLVETPKERDLTFYLHPLRTLVVKHGESSDLKVFHKNQELTTDINIAQMALWNDGREPIRGEHILEEIRIVTKPATPILEVRLRKITRDVCKLSLDVLALADGVVTVHWKVLEHLDGAAIEIVYAGSPNTDFRIKGVIEGQRQIYEETSTVPTVPRQKFTPYRRVAWILAGIAFSTFLVGLVFARRLSAKQNRPMQAAVAFAIVTIIFILLAWNERTPPFEF